VVVEVTNPTSNLVYVISIKQPDQSQINVCVELDALNFIIRDLKSKVKGEIMFPMITKDRSLVENSKVTLAAKKTHLSTCICKVCIERRKTTNPPPIAHSTECKCQVCTVLKTKASDDFCSACGRAWGGGQLCKDCTGKPQSPSERAFSDGVNSEIEKRMRKEIAKVGIETSDDWCGSCMRTLGKGDGICNECTEWCNTLDKELGVDPSHSITCICDLCVEKWDEKIIANRAEVGRNENGKSTDTSNLV